MFVLYSLLYDWPEAGIDTRNPENFRMKPGTRPETRISKFLDPEPGFPPEIFRVGSKNPARPGQFLDSKNRR